MECDGFNRTTIKRDLPTRSPVKKIWEFMTNGKGRWLSFIIVFIIFWYIWDWFSGSVTSESLLPKPWAVVKALAEMPGTYQFVSHLKSTIIELLIGFALGAGAGVILGFVFNFSKVLRRAVHPFVIFFQAIPKVAFVPLIFVWFGMGMESKIVLAIIVSFFPAYVNTLLGLAMRPENGMRLLYSYGASSWQQFKTLQVPSALPLIFAGIRTSLTYAFTAVIVAEFLGGAVGLGSLITRYNSLMRVDRVFAIIFILSIMGLIIYYGIELIGKKLIFWEKGEGEGVPTM